MNIKLHQVYLDSKDKSILRITEILYNDAKYIALKKGSHIKEGSIGRFM